MRNYTILLLLGILTLPALGAPKRTGLHLKKTSSVGSSHTITDANGCTWMIQSRYGTIYGANNVYQNALRMTVGGSNFYMSRSSGYRNSAGDEIEVGPWNRNGVNISRRLKIFKKEGVCRSLDIFENPGSSTINLPVQIRTQFPYGSGTYTSNAGKNSFGSKDWALWNRSPQGNTPATLHIPHGPKSKFRVSVSHNNNYLTYSYTVKIPAKSTVIIAHFEAQNHSTAKIKTLMKGFQASRYFADLEPKVQRMIVNFDTSGNMINIDLERSTRSDLVRLISGSPIYGTIENKEITIETLVGKNTLPAKQLLGLKAKPKKHGEFLIVLADGQILSGTMPKQTLNVRIPNIGTQTIPFTDVKEAAFQITADRPKEIRFQEPFFMMRSGDRLIFQPDSVKLTLQTPNGPIQLKSDVLRQIRMDNSGQAMHKVIFTNGSVLGGMIEPMEFVANLKLKEKQPINRNELLMIDYSHKQATPPNLGSVTTTSGDRLLGKLLDKTITLKSKYGKVKITRDHIRQIVQIKGRDDWVRVILWNGSILDGEIPAETLAFQIIPGPTVAIAPGQILSLVQPKALPPAAVRKDVDALVAQLASESYQDRKAAQKKLIDMGAEIVPFLKKHQANKDPEVQQRLTEILEKIGGDDNAAGNNTNNNNVPPPTLLIGGGWGGGIINGPQVQVLAR